MKKYLKTISYIIVSILVGITAVYAGTLTPPGAPAKTMKSLSDLYELINTGANTPSTDFTTPTYNPSQGTMHSLGDTYDLMKSQLDILTADKIAKDEEVFGRTGTLYGDTDPSKVLTTATYAGTATAGGSYGIPQTGQSHCNAFLDTYGSSSQIPCTGTNQDGDLQNGVTLSYTDNTDGTITDNATGLMWQKCSDGQDSLTCAGAANSFLFDDGNGNGSPAINYCEGLSLATHTDWHLPNIKQLQSIVDYGNVDPAIDTNYFPNTSSANYWSSTAYEYSTISVWIADFDDGSVDYDGMGASHFVRCVRE